MAAHRTLDPIWFNKPAFGYYVWLLEYGAYYGVGRVLGAWQSPEEFGARWFSNPGPFLLIGRLTGLAFALASVLVLYWAGRRLYGAAVGLAAAGLLIASVGHVGASQEVKKDILSALFTLLALLPQIMIVRRGGTSWYWKSGLFAGLGTATKYHPMGMLVPLLVAHLLRPEDTTRKSFLRRQWPLFLGGISWLVGFFVGSPFNFLNEKAIDSQVMPAWRFLLRRLDGLFSLLVAEPEVMSLGGAEPGSMTLTKALGHSWRVLQDGRGAGRWILALALVGSLFGLVKWMKRGGAAAERRQALEVLFLAFAVVWTGFFIAFANRILCEPRHLASLFPLLALLGAIGARCVGEGLAKWLPPARGKAGAITAALAFGCLLPVPNWPGDVILRLNQRRLASDPRVQALRWLEARLPSGTPLINDRDWLPFQVSEERSKTMVGIVDRMDAIYRDALKTARSKPTDDPNRALEIAWATDDIRTLASYRFYWTFRQRARLSSDRPAYDTLVLDKDWFAESWERRRPGSNAYNDLWPRSPFGLLANRILTTVEAKDAPTTALGVFRREFAAALPGFVRKQLEREGLSGSSLDAAMPARLDEARAQFRLTEDSLSLVEIWRRPSPVSDWWFPAKWPKGAAIDWFVSARTTYDNYLIPTKKRVFPDWAEFYSELQLNFDAVEFGSEYADRDPGRTIRVWNLSRRTSTPSLQRIASPD